MRLLEVNGISLLGASHQESVNSLRTSGDVIHLLICDGYDAAEVERLQSEGVLTREAKSTSESVSSLDRVGEEPNHVNMIKVIHILICWNFFDNRVYSFSGRRGSRRRLLWSWRIRRNCQDHWFFFAGQSNVGWSRQNFREGKSIHLFNWALFDLILIWFDLIWFDLIWFDLIWWRCVCFQVLDAVRAAEMLVSNMVPKSPGPNRVDMKTTTIVMSKHTLAPQTSTVSDIYICSSCPHTLALSCLVARFWLLTSTWSIDFQSVLLRDPYITPAWSCYSSLPTITG